MKLAATWSILSARFALLISASNIALSAATLDNLSSQKVMGISHLEDKFLAKALVAWHLGPSLPSIFIGSPSIIPPASVELKTVCNASQSMPNFFRLIVSLGVATVQSVSETAIPIVLVPKSNPISDLNLGNSDANSKKSL